METALLLIDTGAIGLLLYWGLKNYRAGPGKPQTGLFRMADATPKVDERQLARSRTYL